MPLLLNSDYRINKEEFEIELLHSQRLSIKALRISK